MRHGVITIKNGHASLHVPPRNILPDQIDAGQPIGTHTTSKKTVEALGRLVMIAVLHGVTSIEILDDRKKEKI